MLLNILKNFRAEPAADYLMKDEDIEGTDGYNYETDPIDSISYRDGRQSLHALCLVSQKIRKIAQPMLFDQISILEVETLLELVISLAQFPHNCEHVKWLGIGKVFLENSYNEDCQCHGEGASCSERIRHHVNRKADKRLEKASLIAFDIALQDPMIRSFPDVRQLLEMRQELEVRVCDTWHWMTDAAFERVCNLALKLVIFFSPHLRSFRLTSTTWASPYIFSCALGIIPPQITHLGTSSIHHGNDCAKFLTALSIDLSSLRVCYGRWLPESRASRCLESIEELTVVDDGQVELGPGAECRGIEPDFLQLWLEPAKRLRKFLLYTGFDLEGLFGRAGDPLGYNINTILLSHQNSLRHFEWCQMVSPTTTDETAWKKMFGEQQRLWCLPELEELEYLKVSLVFVYTREQWINRTTLYAAAFVPQQPILPPPLGISAPVTTQTPMVHGPVIRTRPAEYICGILTHNLSELGAPPKLKSVDVVPDLPTGLCLTIEL